MRKRTDGFTLVELMVVVLVIGILVAVAVPVFSAAKTKAETNTCQANQRTWAGVVEQVKADDKEPGAPSTGYKTLASGQSIWYTAVVTQGFVKAAPRCPTSGVYYVYDAPKGTAGNGGILGCGGATDVGTASTVGHLLYAKPTAHRYWRLIAADVSHNTGQGTYNNALYTVSFHTSTNGTGTDLCQGVAVTGSSPGSSYVNDGINGGPPWTSICFANGPGPAWFAFDMGAGNSVEVHSVGLYAHFQYYAKSYALQWSDSGTADDWHTQRTFATPGNVYFDTPRMLGVNL